MKYYTKAFIWVSNAKMQFDRKMQFNLTELFGPEVSCAINGCDQPYRWSQKETKNECFERCALRNILMI